MNWDGIEGNWKQFTGKVKEQWGKLTDAAPSVSRGAASAVLTLPFSSSESSFRIESRVICSLRSASDIS